MTDQDRDEENDSSTSSMNVSFKWSEKKVMELDEAIFQAKVEGDLAKKTNRSDVIRHLLNDYIELYSEGNADQRMTVEKITN